MTVNHITKTITASRWELPQVQNYVEHLIPPRERQSWSIKIARGVEYRQVEKKE